MPGAVVAFVSGNMDWLKPIVANGFVGNISEDDDALTVKSAPDSL